MEKVIEVRNISKRFHNTVALDDVSFSLERGEIHALVGENGAGKSTLIKVISGIVQPDEGDILVGGERVVIGNPQEALRRGIATVPQELNLMSDLSVTENIFIGNEVTRGPLSFIDRGFQRKRTMEILEQLGVDIDPDELIRNLSIDKCQIVQIARAIMHDSRILILDEPTTALTDSAVKVLFRILEGLRRDGRSVIFISHRLNEILEITDRVTILRNGSFVTVQDTEVLTEKEIIKYITGKDVVQHFHRTRSARSGDDVPLLEVKNFSGERFQNVSLSIYPGEILGIAGLAGAGQSSLVRTIFGAERPLAGEVRISGERVVFNHPSEAIKAGLGFVPNDRRNLGIFPEMDIRENITVTVLKQLVRRGKLDHGEAMRVAERSREALSIKAASLNNGIFSLSGGNQQKVILARWLAANSRILILDQPTVGIDVGAKFEINALIHKLADEGVCVIYISAEIPELLNSTDRIVVMREGRLVPQTFDTRTATKQQILNAMMG